MTLDRKQQQMKEIFDNLYVCRSSRYLSNDPLFFCHRYTDVRDQEIVGLISSVFAYGKVSSIKQSIERILVDLTPTPHQFITSYDPLSCTELFADFKHRFNTKQDLQALLWAIKTMIDQSGSIGNFFLRFYDSRAVDLTSALVGFTTSILSIDYSPIFGVDAIPAGSRYPFLFPSPASGSACKRLCMFLRWMVRPADGIDLGLWQTIPPSKLIIPVDAHIQRIARLLGLTRRKQADWKMAQEITAVLRSFDSEDPVKYDFSLCHLGISDGCRGHNEAPCLTCALSSLCGKGNS